MLKDLLTTIGVYKVYGRWLKSQLNEADMPHHIGIILDGNRRWAREQNKEPWEGHWAGGEHVKDFLEWCLKTKHKHRYNLRILDRELQAKREGSEVTHEDLRKSAERKSSPPMLPTEEQSASKSIGRRNLLPENLQTLIAT